MITESLKISTPSSLQRLKYQALEWEWLFSAKAVVAVSVVLSLIATAYAYQHQLIIAYGDAESHLNIAKRVVDSLTPGFAQLGGIWLPLPHLLMVPLVKFDFLWRTGLAGSIISGLAFVVSSLCLYQLTLLLTNNRAAGLLSSLVFMLNPNVLYMQTTPMTELTLIAFFLLSTYYFVKYIKAQHQFNYLVLAAFFGLLASLSRYDGWFLVGIEAVIVLALNLPFNFKHLFTKQKVWDRLKWQSMEGKLILFGTLALAGIALWLGWDYLILGDPLYFTHSQFSAKSQQVGWLVRGQLPAYKNLPMSLAYYLVTSLGNIGGIVFAAAVIGFIVFLFHRPSKQKFMVALLMNTAFIFYVATLYLGQSVIFIKPLTPDSFGWNLFNVRYGMMMVPVAAVFFAYLYAKLRPWPLKAVLVMALAVQSAFFLTGKTQAITLEDGVMGLSSQKAPDAQNWIKQNYDGGLVLMDDYARTLSVVKSGIPMQNMIYIGNKPYWEESLVAPEKYATWIIAQKDDAVWKSVIDDQATQDRLYKYFVKVYTSPNILIFKRNLSVQS